MNQTAFRLFLLVAMGALTIALCPSLTPAGQKPAGAVPGSSGPSQPGKIAFINSDTLQDQLVDYKTKIEALNRQFEPRVKEVQTLNDRINALQNTIQQQTSVLPPAKIAEMTEQLEGMKRDQARKREDLETDGNRAKDQSLGPLKEKIGKFLEGYTAKHGIALVVDLANAIESNHVVWYDKKADITDDFVKEYNAANPGASPAK